MDVHGYGLDYHPVFEYMYKDYTHIDSIIDPHFYKSSNLLGCECEDILVLYETGFMTKVESRNFIRDIYELYNEVIVKLPKMVVSYNIVKIVVKLNDKEFTILEYYNDIHMKYYFTREFIKKYSEVTGTLFRYSSRIIPI